MNYLDKAPIISSVNEIYPVYKERRHKMVIRVILGRKGFDGTTGGKPSPIINNKFVSLPIPRADSGDFYKNLMFSPE